MVALMVAQRVAGKADNLVCLLAVVKVEQWDKERVAWTAEKLVVWLVHQLGMKLAVLLVGWWV